MHSLIWVFAVFTMRSHLFDTAHFIFVNHNALSEFTSVYSPMAKSWVAYLSRCFNKDGHRAESSSLKIGIDICL